MGRQSSIPPKRENAPYPIEEYPSKNIEIGKLALYIFLSMILVFSIARHPSSLRNQPKYSITIKQSKMDKIKELAEELSNILSPLKDSANKEVVDNLKNLSKRLNTELNDDAGSEEQK